MLFTHIRLSIRADILPHPVAIMALWFSSAAEELTWSQRQYYLILSAILSGMGPWRLSSAQHHHNFYVH